MYVDVHLAGIEERAKEVVAARRSRDCKTTYIRGKHPGKVAITEMEKEKERDKREKEKKRTCNIGDLTRNHIDPIMEGVARV